MLNEIFPSKYMAKKVAEASDDSDTESGSDEYETDDSDEFETESESETTDSEATEDTVNVNITFTVDTGSDTESEESIEVIDHEKNDAFLAKLQTLGDELGEEYKELPIYKTYLKTQETMKKKIEKRALPRFTSN